MTVNDVIAELLTIKNSGHGDWPVQLMVIENGITLAQDIMVFEPFQDDGDRVWVCGTTKHNSEWITNV